MSVVNEMLPWWAALGLALQAAGARAQQAPPPTANDESATSSEATTEPPSLDTETEALARQLEEVLPTSETASTPPPPGNASCTASGTASARGLSTAFNPAISATASVLGGGTTRSPGARNEDAEPFASGISLQEVELRMSAVVDPYFRADITLAGGAEELDFEEAYLTTLSLPSINIRAGKMLANLGRHNTLHTHAYPFLGAPLPWRIMLGPEGLRDPGLAADILLPLPFFAEVNLQAFSGEWRPLEGDESTGDKRADEDLGYVGHLRTLWDLGASATVELGASYAGGRNGFGGLSYIVAGDLTVKWRPIDAERYTSLEWTTEYIWVDRRRAPSNVEVGGAYSSLRYQFAQRYWLQARGAVLGLPTGASGQVWRGEALFAVVPSELSALRLQYAYEATRSGRVDPVHELFVQAVVSIGSHPAHAY